MKPYFDKVAMSCKILYPKVHAPWQRPTTSNQAVVSYGKIFHRVYSVPSPSPIDYLILWSKALIFRVFVSLRAAQKGVEAARKLGFCSFQFIFSFR